MKFFKHYKNKPYKYIGEAKHSETQEDVVIYETRYENDTAKLWVRPKKMFFEQVQVAGEWAPRFKKIDLEIKTMTVVTAAEISLIAEIMIAAFGEWDEKWFHASFRNHLRYHLLIGFVEGLPAAFKLGYETSPREFYSWLGGVKPDFRGLGIAADLMSRQHEWCEQHGYEKIQTKTQNRFRDMLLLNIGFGFDVTGYQLSDEGGPKIILEKAIAVPSRPSI